MRIRKIIAWLMSAIGFVVGFVFVGHFENGTMAFTEAFTGEIISLGVSAVGLVWWNALETYESKMKKQIRRKDKKGKRK